MAGLFLALRAPRLRFVAAWAVLGAAAIEALEQFRPHYYNTRHFLPVGIALVPLVALALAELWRHPRHRPLAVALLGACCCSTSAGFPDTSGKAAPTGGPSPHFSDAPGDEPIFTGTQYSQLCVAFYAAGPDWLYPGGRGFGPSGAWIAKRAA